MSEVLNSLERELSSFLAFLDVNPPSGAIICDLSLAPEVVNVHTLLLATGELVSALEVHDVDSSVADLKQLEDEWQQQSEDILKGEVDLSLLQVGYTVF